MSSLDLVALGARLERVKQGAFARALDREVDALVARPDTPESYREGVARIRGREIEHVRDVVLPGIDRELRERFCDELARGDDRMLALLLAALVGMPTHRPFFLAAEIVKADAAVERRVLADGLAWLAPAGFYAAHLPAADVASLRDAVPAAFAGEPANIAAIIPLMRSLEPAARARGAVVLRAWEAHRRLVEDATSFDYGCGAGALMDTFASEFRVEGGDLFEGRPCDFLLPILAVLRLVATPDEALDAAGRIGSPRVVRLDACPAAGSPPSVRQYSVVTSIGVMEHVIEDAAFDAVLRKTFSLVRPGGVLLLNANPTLLGQDGHHVLNPWLGVILHRWPWLARQRPFAGRWREGFCRRVSLRSLVDPLRSDLVGPGFLWPNAQRVRERLGLLAPVAGPILRAIGRTELAPVHYLALGKRIG